MICHVTKKTVLTNGTTVFEDVGTLFPEKGGEEGGRGGLDEENIQGFEFTRDTSW